MTWRIGFAGAVAVFVATASGCSTHQAGSPSASSSTESVQSSAQAGGACTLPHFGDLIEWRREPGKTDRAFRLSDVDKTTCQPTLNSWATGLSEAPNVCYMIGWASENVGYNVSALPAPPLHKAMDKIGGAC